MLRRQLRLGASAAAFTALALLAWRTTPESPVPTRHAGAPPRLAQVQSDALASGVVIRTAGPPAALAARAATGAPAVAAAAALRLDALAAQPAHTDAMTLRITANDALGHPAPEIREEALAALGDSGDLSHVVTLRQALQDTDAGVRREAVRALARMGGEPGQAALAAALTHFDRQVRASAAEALADAEADDALAGVATHPVATNP